METCTTTRGSKRGAQGEPEDQEFLITDIGPEDIILGLLWLRHHNPNIDWKKGTLEFDETPPMEQLKMNQKERREWVQAGLISHASRLGRSLDCGGIYIFPGNC